MVSLQKAQNPTRGSIPELLPPDILYANIFLYHLVKLQQGCQVLLIFQQSADFEMSNLAKTDFSVSNLILEMRNFVKFLRNIMEN